MSALVNVRMYDQKLSIIDTASHAAKVIDKVVQTPAKVSRVCRYAAKLTSRFTELPSGIKGPLKYTKFFKTARLPIFTRKLCRHAKETLVSAVKDPVKGGKLLLKTTRDAKKVAGSIIYPCKLFHKAGVLPEVALSWVPLYNTIHPCLSLISFGFAIQGAQKSNKTSAYYTSALSSVENSEDADGKCIVINRMLNDLFENDPKAVEKSLSFPKEFGLDQRMARIGSLLCRPETKKEGIEEGENLAHTLADRCSVLHNLDLLRVGVKVTRVAGWILGGALGFSTLGVGALALASTVSVGSWLWQKYAMNASIPHPEESHSKML